jgi:hypothetical protein
MKKTKLSIATFMLALAGLAIAPAAHATIATAFGNQLTCTAGADGVRSCAGIVTPAGSRGGAPIDVNLFIPPAPASGPDGNFPIIGEFHGWGGSKLGRSNRFLNQGYAYFSISDRGWGNSCGGTDPKRLQLVCLNGYNHLLDTRFEVHDVQQLLGMLADEGIINPSKIGVTGGSYGGGMSMALAALNTRQMPVDYEKGGSLTPWLSPGGIPMGIAAASPDIPWSDLAYSLQPNGRTLDYVVDSSYLGPNGDGRVGIMKQSFVSGFFALGLAGSNYAPPAFDEDADLFTWYVAVSAGEPYDVSPLAAGIIEELTTHHSSYYIDNSVAPAPLHISNGFTDDIFPADEAIRFYNKTIAAYPDAHIQLFFSDHGHQRGQNKSPEVNARLNSRDAWFAYFLKGEGPQPQNKVTVYSQECGAPSLGPFVATSWAKLPKSEIVLSSAAEQIILPEAPADLQSGLAYDPIAGGGACATADGADKQGLASYRLPPAPAGGFTFVGSPTVVADILNVGPNSQIAARLLDVDPATNRAVLVARALYRPNITLGVTPERMVFQLHPNAYRFKEGHVAKLELLPSDVPYGRISNGQLPITVSNLELRLPILEAAGTAGSGDFAPKVLPAGYVLAPDYIPAPPDTDGDGVPDDVDQCPNEAGPASNNGCPLPPPDTTPDAFGFTSVSGVSQNTQVSSNVVTISGIDAPAPIGIAMGEYRINGGGWTSSSGQIVNGQTVQVRHTSANAPGSTVESALNIGGVEGKFRSTTAGTAGNDTDPDAFSFGTKTNQAANTQVASDAITLTGYDAPAPVTAGSGTQYSLDCSGANWTSAPGTLAVGQSLCVRHTTASGSNALRKTSLKVGTVVGYFTTRTSP